MEVLRKRDLVKAYLLGDLFIEWNDEDPMSSEIKIRLFIKKKEVEHDEANERASAR